MFKNITTYTLSVFLFVTIIHADNHMHEQQDGYTICDISFDDEKNHVTSHKCQKCLNKNQKIYSIKEVDNFINERKIRYCIVKNIIDFKSIIFDLNSRPPPNLL